MGVQNQANPIDSTPLDLGARDGMLGVNEMMAFAKITYRQLDYWTRQGIIHTVRPPGGSGTKRYWSIEQARVARALAVLTRLHSQTAGLSILRTANDALCRGERVFDLIPGVTVDLDRLVDEAAS